MTKAYYFHDKNEFSKKGIEVVTNLLKKDIQTIQVDNVESDPTYQKEDVDLIWKYKDHNNNIIVEKIEVKTDNYNTGNFWLETLSNKELKTQGCFLKSYAKNYYYYFTSTKELYIIPIKDARDWFEENYHRFRESETTTKTETGQYSHTTVGRIVPIAIMMSEVKSINRIKLYS